MEAASLALALLASAPVELPEQTVRVIEQAPMYSTAAHGQRTSREFVDDVEVIPGEREVGMELAFLSSPEGLSGRPLPFTDLVVGRLTGRASLGRRFELSGRLDLVAKQPFPGGQPIFGGGALVGRVQISPRTSLFLGAGGSPLFNQPGAAVELGAGWSGRRFLDERHRYFAFAAAVGAEGTGLVRPRAPVRLLELAADGALQFMLPEDEGGVGLEVGTALAIPAWHEGRASWVESSPPFDARTRVRFYLAGYLIVGPRWDLSVRWTVLDRGDAASPATRLPLLAGGYDQTELTFGVSYRFGPNVRDR